TLDPVHFAHPDTTEIHQEQVMQYIRRMQRGKQRGPGGPTSMSDAEFRKRWPQAKIAAMKKRSPKPVRHEDIAPYIPLGKRTYYTFFKRNSHFLPSITLDTFDAERDLFWI